MPHGNPGYVWFREIGARRRALKLLSGAAALAMAASGAPAVHAQSAAPAASQTTLGEVVVTARRKNEVLQRVPEAISAVRPADIESHGVFSMRTASQVAPGIHVDTAVSATAPIWCSRSAARVRPTAPNILRC